MVGFLGSYLHQIDGKGRVSLPASFRREAADLPMVLVQAHDDSLSLYAAAAWAGVEARLRDLLRLQPGSRAYVLGVTANAAEVVPDKQGRILIPQRLLDGAGLKDSALLVGVIDRVEVWDPARFRETQAQASDYERFSHQIFG